jgi:hypothetical protein
MNARLEGKTTSNQSVVNLINCLLGAGVLGFPYCFKSCGLVLASCIMLVSLLACRFSYSLLLYCSQLSSKRTYEELTEQALGPMGKKTVEICTAALNLGCMVAYLNILADVLSSVAGTIIPPGAEPSRSVYLAGVTLFGAFPVAMIVRDHHVVQAFSAASVGFILIFTLIILILAASPAAHPTSLSTTKLWEQDGLLVAFPVMAYCFTAHPYYLGIYQNLQQPTHKRMLWVTDLALLFAAGVYFLVGMSGYLMFRSRTAGDLLRNFGAASVGGARGSYERAVKLFYGLSILGSVPLVILPFYNIVLPLLGFDKDPEYDGSKTSPSLSGSSATSDKAHQSDTEEDADTEEEGSKRPRSSLDSLDPRVSQVKSDEAFAQPLLHATIALVILGAAMASAIWIPNGNKHPLTHLTCPNTLLLLFHACSGVHFRADRSYGLGPDRLHPALPHLHQAPGQQLLLSLCLCGVPLAPPQQPPWARELVKQPPSPSKLHIFLSLGMEEKAGHMPSPLWHHLRDHLH